MLGTNLPTFDIYIAEISDALEKIAYKIELTDIVINELESAVTKISSHTELIKDILQDFWLCWDKSEIAYYLPMGRNQGPELFGQNLWEELKAVSERGSKTISQCSFDQMCPTKVALLLCDCFDSLPLQEASSCPMIDQNLDRFYTPTSPKAGSFTRIE